MSRKIEYWYQGSIAAFKIIYRDEHGSWNGEHAARFDLCETDEKKAMTKLLSDAHP